MKILVFSHFFPPEIGAAPMRIGEHALKWVCDGHNVTVVTNFPNSPFGELYEGYKNSLYKNEFYHNIKVKRILTFPSGKKNNKFHRGLSFIVNTIGSILAGIVEKKPDIIIASAPYLSGIPGLISSIWHNIPFIYELRDPWVQVAAANKTVKKRTLQYKLLVMLERKIIDASEELVVIGEEMASYLEKKMMLPKKPYVIHNAIDTNRKNRKAFKGLNLPKTDGCFVIGLIGNMGDQYNFDVILDAAAELLGGDFLFIFLGEGKQQTEVKKKAKKMDLENVRFYPAVPASEVDDWFRICDVTLVSMKTGPIYRVYLPLKVLDSLAMGVPVLFGGSGEVEHILNESLGGAVFPAGDKKALVKLITERMQNYEKVETEGKSGAEFILKRFTRERMARRYECLLEEVVREYRYKRFYL